MPQGLVLNWLYLLFHKALLYAVAELDFNKPVGADALDHTGTFRSAYYVVNVDGLIYLLQALASIVPFLLAFFWVRLVVLLANPFSRPL